MKVRLSKKSLSTMLALTLVAGVAAGGTLAWLFEGSEKVTNTFTVGDINIAIDESISDSDSVLDVDYHMVPGDQIARDPAVIIESGSEANHLFLAVKPVNNEYAGLTGGILDYTVDDTVWTPVNSVVVNGATVDTSEYLYYTEVDLTTANAGATYNILKDTVVTVNGEITKDMVTAITGATSKPKIDFAAFAHQSANTDFDTAAADAVAYFQSLIG